MPKAVPPPYEVAAAIEALGERIRHARMRRQLSQDDLAQACGISRRTLFSIEAGAPGMGIANIYTVLWKLGLLATTSAVADPDADDHGKILEAARLGARARRTSPREDTDF
ncbi:helix-turn-helix domain-containing protein [Ramlibacter sp.]|uniref:helix-turn-helix domain-containing protein n=1 Tax=Ramlibacter sp. TaxID=1917967 RepID=UPI003D0ABD53